MAAYLQQLAESLDFSLEQRAMGIQAGTPNLELPPVLLGRLGTDSNKKTILIYGHYDVQPAEKSDGWTHEPFEVFQHKDGRLIGRGITDDKGPVIAWFNAIQAYQRSGVELPVNLIFCIEGMEESGSEGLESLIRLEKSRYFKDVDAICISDNYWLGSTQPVLTYGLRGCSYYALKISGPNADLHSGVFGGTCREPTNDLIHLMSKLTNPQGDILIPGLQELVAPLTTEEAKLYDNITFSMQDLYKGLGNSYSARFESEKETLMARWREPALSIHGIEGAFAAPGAKTVIPASVTGKFSIRTVPNMEPAKVDKLVFDYVNKCFQDLHSHNQMTVSLINTGKWWLSSPKDVNFEAAAKATEAVWGKAPDLTREGGSIPVCLIFEQTLGKNVLLLPMGRGDDGAHSVDEKLDVLNYIEGTKTFIAYLHYISNT
ncbi:glutamate carboxypeptidase [Nadsonia fulvescens var. elongata DSM 6958]|uniref:Glutamate carboxypeptidase n=1 Tax=Nadsonia fulvescens var. elongata DSM 6958 TaxID=857566 RepID=A0A1E3PDW2_9ASCO|nr:glutamate carboxypeptidase [Nadsonia fulvescens var. elongata DSM 6958]